MNVSKSNFFNPFAQHPPAQSGNLPFPTPAPTAAAVGAELPAPSPVPSPAPSPAPVVTTPPAQLAPVIPAAPAPVAPVVPPAPVAQAVPAAAPLPAAPIQDVTSAPVPAAPTPVTPAPADDAFELPQDAGPDLDVPGDASDPAEDTGDLQEPTDPDGAAVDADATVPAGLREPVGTVFGHLAALMTPGSALSFTLSIDGEVMTAQVRPLNLNLPELTLTGTVAEFDSPDFLDALLKYRPAVQGGLRAQAQRQAQAASKVASKPTAPAAAPSAPAPRAADRSTGTLAVTCDVPGATLVAVRGTERTPLTADTRLQPGKVTVEATAEGFRAASQSVKVERGKATPVTLRLGGRLVISAPEGAVVTAVNAQGEPVSPDGPLPDGQYKVVVEADGKKPFTWHGTVRAADVAVTATLDDAPPSLF